METKICIFCGQELTKTVLRKNGKNNDGTQRLSKVEGYCSRSCHVKHRQNKREYREWNCKTCNAPMNTKEYNYNQVFCSEKCGEIAYSRSDKHREQSKQYWIRKGRETKREHYHSIQKYRLFAKRVLIGEGKEITKDAIDKLMEDKENLTQIYNIHKAKCMTEWCADCTQKKDGKMEICGLCKARVVDQLIKLKVAKPPYHWRKND
jgi:endogenous inhibitor of DNA gyrase (YacG/DUF329 family)